MSTPLTQAPLTVQVTNEQNQPVSLQDTLGQYVVLYFYPKDDTPGCTTEACDFQSANDQLQKLGAKVIGVSADNQASHQKFKNKHELQFELWSDPAKKLISAFGAWGEKKRFGKILLGIKRQTFIIDPQGKVIKAWLAVKPANHAQQVLEFLQSIIKA